MEGLGCEDLGDVPGPDRIREQVTLLGVECLQSIQFLAFYRPWTPVKGSPGLIETTDCWTLFSKYFSSCWALVFVLLFVSLFIVLTIDLTLTANMGQIPSSLELCLERWGDVKATAHNNSVEIRKGKFNLFCNSEWSSFKVRWPAEEFFDASLIGAMKNAIYQPRTGHPDQIPYKVTWWGLIENPPPYVKHFLHQQVKVLAAERKPKGLASTPIPQGGSDEEAYIPPPEAPEPAKDNAGEVPLENQAAGGSHAQINRSKQGNTLFPNLRVMQSY